MRDFFVNGSGEEPYCTWDTNQSATTNQIILGREQVKPLIEFTQVLNVLGREVLKANHDANQIRVKKSTW